MHRRMYKQGRAFVELSQGGNKSDAPQVLNSSRHPELMLRRMFIQLDAAYLQSFPRSSHLGQRLAGPGVMPWCPEMLVAKPDWSQDRQLMSLARSFHTFADVKAVSTFLVQG